MLAALLLGAAATLAMPSDLATKFSWLDYPREDERELRSAAAIIEFLIGPDGQPLKCVAPTTYGDPELAAKICPIVLGKHFKPATFLDGAPAYGFVRTLLRFFDPRTEAGVKIGEMQLPVDFELTDDKLPSNGRAFSIWVAFAVNEAGVATDCGAPPKETHKAAADLVCRARNGTDLGQRTDVAGRPIAYVTYKLVRLIPKAAQSAK